MTFEITFGYWLIPAIVTVIAFGWHLWMHKDEPKTHSGYGNIGAAAGRLITLFMAAIVALVAWLIFAVMT